MELQRLLFENISPFVRYAEDVYIPHGKKQVLVNTYDHRLFYVVKGKAIIEINGSIQEVMPGSVAYWMSGTTYVIRPDPDSVLHTIAINFDFTGNRADTVKYLPMTSPQEYDPDKRMENVVFDDAVVMNSPIVLDNLPEVLTYLRAMVRETAIPKNLGSFQLSSLMRIVLVHLYREALQRQQVRSSIKTSESILDYIHGHYAEDIDNKTLAERFNYNTHYISELIAAQTGTPLHKYLLKVRIRQAIYLLETTDLSINEIAHQVGFKNTSYFSQYFKQCTGHSPRAFRIR